MQSYINQFNEAVKVPLQPFSPLVYNITGITY